MCYQFCSGTGESSHPINSSRKLVQIKKVSVRIQALKKGIYIFQTKFSVQRGCCIRSPLARKLLHVFLFHEDNTQRDLNNSSPWYACDLSLHWVSAMYVHYFWRYEHFSERQRHFLALRFYSYPGKSVTAQSTCYYNETHFYYQVNCAASDLPG